MGWRRHITECTVSVLPTPLAPYKQPEKLMVIADVFWLKLQVGEGFVEELRAEDGGHNVVRAQERVLRRVLERARMEHPTARLAKHPKYTDRYVFEIDNAVAAAQTPNPERVGSATPAATARYTEARE